VSHADAMPVEALLAGYPDATRAIAETLRGIVRRAAPDAIERVRPGWRLIGYDLPITARRSTFFCWVTAEPKHAHLGFKQGVAMDDPERRLEGHGITILARWLTFVPGDLVEEAPLAGLIREAVRITRLSPSERAFLTMERRA
jgi:hypothetical protein